MGPLPLIHLPIKLKGVKWVRVIMYNVPIGTIISQTYGVDGEGEGLVWRGSVPAPQTLEIKNPKVMCVYL